jgi:hypothetical protein
LGVLYKRPEIRIIEGKDKGGIMLGFIILWSIIGVIVVILLILILRTRFAMFKGRRRDYKVKYVICAAHGIRTKGKWIIDLFTLLKDKYPEYANPEETRLIPIRYGYLLASICVLGFVKNYLINWMRRKLEAYCEMYPAASIIYFGHSYGTLLGYEALRRSDNIYLDRLVLVASIVSSHEIFDDTLGMRKVREIYCFCSEADEVCKYNPFGHSGYWGFRQNGDNECSPRPYDELEVYNYCKKNMEHSGYFADEETRSEWMEILDPREIVTPLPDEHWLCPFMASSNIYSPACVKEICKLYDKESNECLLVVKKG